MASVSLSTFVCILRYSGCSSLPIQSSVCYDIQNGSLCRSSFLYATLFQNASLSLSGVLYATLFKILPFTNLIPIRFKKLPTTRTGRHSARLRPSAGFFSSFRSECTAEAQDTGWLCFCRRGVLLRCQPPTKPQTGQYPEPRRPVSHQTVQSPTNSRRSPPSQPSSAALMAHPLLANHHSLTPPKNRTDSLPAGRLHGRDPVRRSKPLVILGA